MLLLKALKQALKHPLLCDEDGVTAIEYGLLAALISMLIVGSVLTLGTTLDTLFIGKVATCVTNRTTLSCQ